MLALALVFVFTLTALAAATLQLSRATTLRQATSTNHKLAFYMAESGLAEAYVGLMIGKTGKVGSEHEPAVLGDGLFWVEAREDLEEGTVTLDCTAMVGNGRAILSMVVERGEPSVAALGVFSDASLDVPPGSLVDGFDSSHGPYSAPKPARKVVPRRPEGGTEPSSPPPGMGKMGSNDPIQVAGTRDLPTRIDGDLAPGPSSEVSVTGEVSITGSTAPASAAVRLPPVVPPSYPLARGVEHGSGTPLQILPGEIGIEFLTVREGAQATIQGPSTLLIGSLLLEAGAELVLDETDGAIDLHVIDVLDLQAGSTITTTGRNPSRITVQVSGTTAGAVELGSRGEFYGVIYAPESDVVVRGEFEVFGALVGKNVQFAGPVRLHFDRFLETLSAEASLPTLLSWRIVEISTPNGMGHDANPFAYLSLDKATLPSPANAHADQQLDVTYLDSLGAPRTYSGAEKAFDWGDVEKVTEISRDGRKVQDIPAMKGNLPSSVEKRLLAIIDDGLTSSSDLETTLNDSSPLSSDVLEAAINRKSPMDSSDLTAVLLANSPLSAQVLQDARNRVPPLAPSDLAQVIAAQ